MVLSHFFVGHIDIRKSMDEASSLVMWSKVASSGCYPGMY